MAAQSERFQVAAEEDKAWRLYTLLKLWNFDIILQYCVERRIFRSRKLAEQVLEEYLRYLALDQGFKKATPISDLVDKFWHTHMIFSEDYQDMCWAIFGEFRHHRPSILGPSSREEDTGMSKYPDVFKCWPPSNIWPDGPRGSGKCCRF